MKLLFIFALLFCNLSHAADCNSEKLRGPGWTRGVSSFLWDTMSNHKTSMFAMPVEKNKPLQLSAIKDGRFESVTLVFMDTSNVAKFQASIDQLVDDFSFGAGCVDSDGRDLFDIVGSVRDKQMAVEMESYVLKRGGAERKRDLDNAAAQRKAAQKQQDELSRIDNNKFKSTLNHKNPQVMYLAAGNYERRGEADRAVQIYENIIARYPESIWAVKANDQLISAKRVDDAAASARQRQYESEQSTRASERRAQGQCALRIDKCKESCGFSSGSYSCKQRCDSICSQF